MVPAHLRAAVERGELREYGALIRAWSAMVSTPAEWRAEVDRLLADIRRQVESEGRRVRHVERKPHGVYVIA